MRGIISETGRGLSRFFLFLQVLLTFGCAHQKFTNVNVYAENKQDQAKGNTFVILKGKWQQEETGSVGPRFQEYVEKALALNGLKKADDLEKADVALILSYGVGSPSEHNVLSAPFFFSQTDFIGLPNQSGLKAYIRRDKETTYLRYLLICAVDLKEYSEKGRIKQLWRTTATHVGKNDKLDKIFPYLATALVPYFGKHSLEKIKVPLTLDDETLLKIKESSEKDSSQNQVPISGMQ